MKHYTAIKCIQKRITQLQSEVIKSEKIMDEPEMMADYIFAKDDVDNFKKEIQELTDTIDELTKIPEICQN